MCQKTRGESWQEGNSSKRGPATEETISNTHYVCLYSLLFLQKLNSKLELLLLLVCQSVFPLKSLHLGNNFT